MTKFQASPMVWVAMARHELEPGDLRSYEVTDVDVFLHLKDKSVIRVEISSLPAVVVEASRAPETTQAAAPGTAQAAPEPHRADNASKRMGTTRAKTARKRATVKRKPTA